VKVTKTVWFSSGGGFSRRGPYETQQEAYEGMRLTDEARKEQRASRGTDSPYPYDALVWPEYIRAIGIKG